MCGTVFVLLHHSDIMQLVFSAAVEHQVKLFECSLTDSFLCVSCSNIPRHDADQVNVIVVVESCCTVLCCTVSFASCTVLSTVVTAALFVTLSLFFSTCFVVRTQLTTHSDDN